MISIVKTPSNFNYDAWYHLSRINSNVMRGINIFDPYLLENGKNVISSNYASNILHIIMSTGVGITGLTSFDFWLHSSSIIRIIYFLTLYVFVREVTKKKVFSAFFLFIFYLINFASIDLFVLIYPTNFASMLMLFLAGFVINFFGRENKFSSYYPIYFFLVLLLGFTHQIQFLSFCFFLFLLTFYFLIKKKIVTKKAILFLLPSLLLVPLIIFTFINSSSVPENISNNFYMYFKETNGGFLKQMESIFFSMLINIASLFSSIPVLFTAFIGGLFFIKKLLPDKTMRNYVLFISITSFFYIFSPITLLILNYLPYWAIVRQKFFLNIFVYIIGTGFIWFLLEKSQKEGRSKVYGVLAVVVFITAIVPSLMYPSPFKRIAVVNYNNKIIQDRVQDIDALKKKIEPGSTILANPDFSFILPGHMDVYVVGIDEDRTTDSIDTTKSSQAVIDFLNPKVKTEEKERILVENGVDYVILSRGETKTIPISEIGLKLVSIQGDYFLYKPNI